MTGFHATTSEAAVPIATPITAILSVRTITPWRLPRNAGLLEQPRSAFEAQRTDRQQAADLDPVYFLYRIAQRIGLQGGTLDPRGF
jgi:hypothetical protein